MTTKTDIPISGHARPVAALALALAVPLLLGCLLAPHVFSALSRMQAQGALPAWLGDDLRFERVASRCVTIVAALLLFPAIKLSGLGARIAVQLTLRPSRWTALARSVVIGCASMGIIYVGGWIVGAYRLGNETGDLVTEMGTIVLFLLSAVVVGVFEETFFRGFIFGSLRQCAGFWPAALLAGAFFSSLHFFRPDMPGVVTEVTWRSGFDLLPYLFARFNLAADWASVLTLFVMGVTLCLYYEKQGHLYYVIGLHGGWVWAMRLGGHYLDRNKDVLASLFSRSDVVARSPLALVVILAFFIAALNKRKL